MMLFITGTSVRKRPEKKLLVLTLKRTLENLG